MAEAEDSLVAQEAMIQREADEKVVGIHRALAAECHQKLEL